MKTKMMVRVILSTIGGLILIYHSAKGAGLEYVTHQTYNALKIIGVWLFLIWVAIVTKEDE